MDEQKDAEWAQKPEPHWDCGNTFGIELTVSAGYCTLGADLGHPALLIWNLLSIHLSQDSSEPKSDVTVKKAHSVLGYSCGPLEREAKLNQKFLKIKALHLDI